MSPRIFDIACLGAVLICIAVVLGGCDDGGGGKRRTASPVARAISPAVEVEEAVEAEEELEVQELEPEEFEELEVIQGCDDDRCPAAGFECPDFRCTECCG